MPDSPDHLPGDGLAPWYVVDGAQRGPLPESTLAEWIGAGLVSGSALVWRHGLAAWEPISRHFASAGARTDIAAEDPSQPARDGKQRSEPSPASRWVPLLAAGLIAALFYDQRVELSRSLPPAWIAGAWAGAVLASLGFGILAAVKWWQYAARQARGSRVPHLWGILKLACAMLGICLVVGEAIAGYVGTQVYRVAVARQIYNHYTMKIVGDDLVIKGEIGPGFASRMDGILINRGFTGSRSPAPAASSTRASGRRRSSKRVRTSPSSRASNAPACASASSWRAPRPTPTGI
jgi:hypothetical protein